jgi:hypothetical protein
MLVAAVTLGCTDEMVIVRSARSRTLPGIALAIWGQKGIESGLKISK